MKNVGNGRSEWGSLQLSFGQNGVHIPTQQRDTLNNFLCGLPRSIQASANF
jgi:hypothetical protein